MRVAKVNFNDCIGSDFWGGISESFVRYCVEGPGSFDPAAEPAYPDSVELHFFNCPGGEVYEGYAIYSYLRHIASKGVKVSAHIHALCASIASLIVLAADERLIGPLGSVMIHKPLVDAGPWANADDHRRAAEMLDTIEGQITGVYTSRTTIDAATLPDLMRAETTFNDTAALANGFATGLLADAVMAAADPKAAKVLNYARPPFQPTPAAMAALNETEEKSLFDKFKNWLTPKNEDALPVEPAPLPVTNASSDIDGGDTMYYDGTLAVDTAVYSDADMTVAYADGTYATTDGQSVTVSAGIATAVSDAANAAEEVTVTNSADLEVANAKIAELEGKLTAANLSVTGLKNKLAKVPGSAGNPTPAGAAQNLISKPGAPASAGNSLINIRRS